MRLDFADNKTPWYILALLLSLLLPFVFLDAITRFPRGLMSDDAYFYVNIAYNLGSNGFSSFDGVNLTDGYHLLWCWLLAVVSFCLSWLSTEKTTHLAAMIGVYLALCSVIGLYFSKKIHHFLYFVFIGIIFKIMMESTLVGLLLLLFLQHFFVPAQTQGNSTAQIALLLLIPLARIDATIFIFVLSLYFLLVEKRPRHFLFINAVMALGVGLQLLAMWFTAGSMTGVAAQLKTSGIWNIADNLRANTFGSYYYSGLIQLLVFLVFLALAVAKVWYMDASSTRNKCVFILLAATSFIALHLCANNTVRYWYYVPSFFMLLYLLVNIAQTPVFISRATMALALLTIGAVGLKYSVDGVVRADEINYSKAFVAKLHQHIPATAHVFQIDASGYVGTFSGRTIINGDGLVNTHSYAQKLKSKQLAQYLDDNDIVYIIHNEYPKKGVIFNYHGLKVSTSDVERIIDPPAGLATLTAFGLYKLKVTDAGH